MDENPDDRIGAAPTARAGVREWAALGVLTLAVVLLAVDGTVLSLAVPALSADLGATATQVLWIGDIYSFALAGLLITMGNVADRIGRKRLLLIGSALFGVASLLAAFAPSADLLIVARALLGIAGATLMPSTLSIVRNIFLDDRQRTKAIAVWTAGAVAGGAVGPLVGGALLEHFWWGSVFLINVPVMVVLVVFGVFLLPESKNPAAGPIDLLSAGLSVATIVPLVFAVKQTVSEGLSALVILAVVVALAAGTWFVRRQLRLTTPLIDVTLFSNGAFTGAVMSNTLAIFSLVGLLFFFSQYLQLVRGYGPLKAGLAELPSTLASLAVIVMVAWIVARLGRGRAIAGSLFLAAFGLFVMAWVLDDSGYLGIGVALAIVGLGVGIAMTVSTDTVVGAVPRERAGSASAVSETAYELGVALGIALLGSLVAAMYRVHLDLETLPDRLREPMGDSLASATAALNAASDAESAALLIRSQEAFTQAVQDTSIVAAVLTLIGGLVAWWLIPRDLATTGSDDLSAHVR